MSLERTIKMRDVSGTAMEKETRILMRKNIGLTATIQMR